MSLLNTPLTNNFNYTWDAKYEKNKQDDVIFPTKLYNEYLSFSKSIINKTGNDFFNIISLLNPMKYLTNHIHPQTINGHNINDIIKYMIVKKKDSRNMIYNIFNKMVKHKANTILVYKFNDFLSILTYTIIRDILKNGDTILLISNNDKALDAILYYQKYVNNKFNPTKLTFILYNHNNDTNDAEHLAQNSDIEPINDISKINVNHKKDFVLIDISSYDIDESLNIINLSLSILNIGGSLVMYVNNIKNIHIFNLYSFIASYFKYSTITDTSIRYLYSSHKHYIIFSKYTKYAKLNTDYLPSTTSKEIKNMYRQYYEYITKVYIDKINLFQEINNLFINYDSKDVVTIMKNDLIESIDYATHNGLDMVDWIDAKEKQIYHNMTKSLYKNIDISINQLPQTNDDITINKYNRIDITKQYQKRIKLLYHVHELAYAYHEKESKELYTGLEKYINYRQKKLQKKLLYQHNIHINNNSVSRAWIKLYELYRETNFFDNLTKKSIKSFHICEAPGNFIASTIYYIDKNTDIQQYIWNAQTLYEGHVYDQYNFIKQTKDRWDFGKDGSGDLTKYDNFVHYVNKYKNSDMLVGDCGIGVTTNLDQLHDLANYQLLYALLIPRVGGNFIIKTHANNINLQFLSLVYIAQNKYNKLYIFKSSRNFWSSEIYLVGIGFRGINKNERNIIHDIAKNLDNGIKIFPINNIPESFIDTYEAIINKLINKYTYIKKFLVYLIRHPNNIDIFKKNIITAVDERNRKWIIKYMSNLK